MEMVSSVPCSSSASDDDFDDESLLKKLCMLLCMPQNAPECPSEHLAMFSTSANDITPPSPRWKCTALSELKTKHKIILLPHSLTSSRSHGSYTTHCGVAM